MTKGEISQNIYFRPPIVAVLGHVDHGKTTLLDSIRKTSVAQKEAGGITQGIGASVVTTTDGKRITFIDTPGHAAFSKMRERGADVCDIAILVVSADDGVKPQTKEALSHILGANIPFIVAVTKIDLASSSIETVKTQLEKEGLKLEGRGGDVPVVGVSGKTKEGIDNLLEVISLISEINEVRGDPLGNLEAVIIEEGKNKGGQTATVIVRNGTLKVGDEVCTETETAKVRAISDYKGDRVEEIAPGEPGLILGFENLPPVGSLILKSGEGKTALVANEQKRQLSEEDKVRVIIKAKNQGAIEAIVASLPQGAGVISESVGDATESDILLAKTSKALVYCFESKIPASVLRLAETEGVKVKRFEIIYELLDEIEKLFKSDAEEVLGKAAIVAIFPFEKSKVAGCKVVSGKIEKNDKVLLLSKGKTQDVKISSIKREKRDIQIAKQGEECGILFYPQLDFEVGDVLLSVRR